MTSAWSTTPDGPKPEILEAGPDPMDLLAAVQHHATEATRAIVDEHEGHFRTHVEAVARTAVRLLDYMRSM